MAFKVLRASIVRINSFRQTEGCEFHSANDTRVPPVSRARSFN